MDPSTGKILAMVSKPDFDPNTVSQNWNELSTSEDSVLPGDLYPVSLQFIAMVDTYTER